MIDMEEYLYGKVKPIILSWNEPGIYAISFFVYSNEAYEYGNYSNLSEFSISYNTEDYCRSAPQLSEERWNFAFWQQNSTDIISSSLENNEGIKTLVDWYSELGLDNIGYEDFSGMYDDESKYIGKGPIGYYELLCAVSNVARRLQQEGVILVKFNKAIPIIVHELEYAWFVEDATRNANPNGEADIFLDALDKGFQG